MVDKSTILQIFGALMKHPQYLSETDKYNLTPSDFYYKLDKYIFVAIDSLYRNGAAHIQPIDVENYLQTNESASIVFKQQKGIEYLQDADYLSAEENFPYYYRRLKKFNLLQSFKDKGIDTSEFYIEDALNQKALEVNEKFEELEISDIINGVKKKLLGIERAFVQNDTTETSKAFDDIQEIIDDAGTQANVGLPLQGEIFNEVCAGARKGKFYLRSAGSGTGKTRQAVGDACYLAFPFRYDTSKREWVQEGSNERVVVITTEQTKKERDRNKGREKSVETKKKDGLQQNVDEAKKQEEIKQEEETSTEKVAEEKLQVKQPENKVEKPVDHTKDTFNKAVRLYNTGRYKDALRYFEQVKKEKPQYPEIDQWMKMCNEKIDK